MADRKHSHYFKPTPFDSIDVYRVLQLFEVSDPCLQHAVKKLLVAGGRGGGKDISRDVQEAIDTLVRWQEMRGEEERARETVDSVERWKAARVDEARGCTGVTGIAIGGRGVGPMATGVVVGRLVEFDSSGRLRDHSIYTDGFRWPIPPPEATLVPPMPWPSTRASGGLGPTGPQGQRVSGPLESMDPGTFGVSGVKGPAGATGPAANRIVDHDECEDDECAGDPRDGW